MSTFLQLAVIWSLVAERSEIGGNSADISKGISRNDISEFESSRPSQAVASL